MADGNWTKRGSMAIRLSAALVATAAGMATLGVLSRPPAPAYADGPAPCSSGGPTNPFHGYCATYGGRNTFYGSYGLGFPTPTGWGFCAENAATGGDYPSPSFGYSPSGAPPGADTANDNALGFALSRPRPPDGGPTEKGHRQPMILRPLERSSLTTWCGARASPRCRTGR